MQKILLTLSWFVITPIVIIISFFLYVTSSTNNNGSVMGAQSTDVEIKTSYKLYTALPSFDTVSEDAIIVDDARVEIVRRFLTKYSSPLIDHAKQLVDASVKYHLDFRLLPAVAMQESQLCKKIPDESHNCWGYGIYGDKVLRFSSYDEAIEKVASGLSSNYVSDGLTTPELIMSRYTPSSNGSWAASVRHFMEMME